MKHINYSTVEDDRQNKSDRSVNKVYQAKESTFAFVLIPAKDCSMFSSTLNVPVTLLSLIADYFDFSLISDFLACT